MQLRTLGAIFLAPAMLMIPAGCTKKIPTPPPVATPKVTERTTPPPPPPARPRIANFVADPLTIDRGQSSTLRWTVEGANDISISQGIGSVQGSGSRTVYPSATTTYTLTAKGAGGSSDSNATVSVNIPAPPAPPVEPSKGMTISFKEWMEKNLEDIYFDYDKNDIREDARASLTRNADKMKSALSGDYKDAVFIVEGHCDERGSAEYNLGLGDRRSTSSKEFMTQLGVPGDRLKTVSYGKERPACSDNTEACWQKNRRAHFAGQ